MSKCLHVCFVFPLRFSGITEESMIGVTMSLRDVQSVLLSMFYEDTILLGHSLESDLRSLKVSVIGLLDEPNSYQGHALSRLKLRCTAYITRWLHIFNRGHSYWQMIFLFF